MVSRWKSGSALLIYRNKPGHLSPHRVLSNWLLQISVWILQMGTRPIRTSCRFGLVVGEIRIRSGLWLLRDGSVSLLLPFRGQLVNHSFRSYLTAHVFKSLSAHGLSLPMVWHYFHPSSIWFTSFGSLIIEFALAIFQPLFWSISILRFLRTFHFVQLILPTNYLSISVVTCKIQNSSRSYPWALWPWN